MPGCHDEYPYDSLIVAAGAGQSYFGHDEFALIAPGMKTIDDAMELRRRVYGALELAETMPDAALQRFWTTFVVVGAGPTGVELSGQIRELAARSLRRDFRRIDPTAVRVVLVDGGSEPLANFGDRLSGRARADLEKMGVELQMGLRVVGVDPLGVDAQGAAGEERRFEGGTVIWAAGVQASPLAAMLAQATGAETDRAGRISVQPDLSLPGYPEIFAIGDMASINQLPGVCEVAMQGGLHAANTIKRRRAGKDSVPFKYRDLGSAATHRPIQGHRQRPRDPARRLPRLGRLVLRPHRVPQRVRPPGQHDAAMVPSHDRALPARTRLQRRPHGRGPEPARRGEGQGHAQSVPGD